MSDKVFTFGKYKGISHKEIANSDPSYILWVYEEHQDNGGISNEMYRLAQINLNEQQAESDIDWHEYEVGLEVGHEFGDLGD